MLNKVSNIENSKSYGSRKKLNSYEKYMKHSSLHEDISQDSISFSPAAVFLTQVNWRMNEVDYSSANNVLFDFFIEDIRFKINVDFAEFYRNSYQKVVLLTERQKFSKKKKYQVTVCVKKPDVRLYEKYSSFPIRGVQAIFDKLEKLNFTNEMESFERILNDTIVEELEENILVDFTNIFYVIYSFIYKLKKFDIQNRMQFPIGEKGLLRIDRILTHEN